MQSSKVLLQQATFDVWVHSSPSFIVGEPLLYVLIISAEPDGSPIIAQPNSAIPQQVIFELDEMLNSGSTLEDAVTYIRIKLVPAGYALYPFRKAQRNPCFRN